MDAVGNIALALSGAAMRGAEALRREVQRTDEIRHFSYLEFARYLPKEMR